MGAHSESEPGVGGGGGKVPMGALRHHPSCPLSVPEGETIILRVPREPERVAPPPRREEAGIWLTGSGTEPVSMVLFVLAAPVHVLLNKST